jgi:threonine/homoserine/homoserine lactone efflux protein
MNKGSNMNTLAIFFFVSLVSTATPGPAVFYVTSQGMFGGMRSGLPAALGILAADFLYIALSVTGLSAMLAASYELFTLLKWAGAVYLIYLGARLLRSTFSKSTDTAPTLVPVGYRSSFLSGFALHAANPKALLYFGSLVPQFVNSTQPLGPQLASLAGIHLLTAAGVLLTYAALSSHLRGYEVRVRMNRAFKVVAGSSLVGAGVSMALLRKGSE